MPSGHLHSSQLEKSAVLAQLLKGPVYRETHLQVWQGLLKQEGVVRDYMAQIHLDVFIDEENGFAFLRQIEEPDNFAPDSAESDIDMDGNSDDGFHLEKSKSSAKTESLPNIPRLISKRVLSFPVSVLCTLLRKRLAEHDNLSSEPRLVLSEDELCEILSIYFDETGNETKQRREMLSHIQKVIELGVLRRLKNDSTKLEVMRILKALFDAEELSRLNQTLQEYQDYGRNSV